VRSLLIVAHGSRREKSNEEVRQLAQQIATDGSSGFDEVTAAFLELASPSIPEGLEGCIQRGATEVVVFPHFLSAGRHVVEDIPAEVLPVKQKFPGVKIRIAPHLGLSPALSTIIVTTANQTRS